MKTIINKVIDDISVELLKNEKNDINAYDNVPEGFSSLLVAASYQKNVVESKKNLLVVTQSNLVAKNIATELQYLLGSKNVIYLPGFESIPYDYSSLSRDISIERIKALYSIINSNKAELIITSIGNMVRKLPDIKIMRSLQFVVKKNEIISPQKLANRLIVSGYKRKPQVEAPGEFSLRGDILDIFIANFENPVRLEYFDDEIEKIKEFHVSSQLSFAELEKIIICPACEFVLGSKKSNTLIDKMQKTKLDLPQWFETIYVQEGELSLNQFDQPGLQELYSMACELSSFLDYFESASKLLILDPAEVYKTGSRIEYEYTKNYSELFEKQICPKVDFLINLFHKELCDQTELTKNSTYVFYNARFKNQMPEDLQHDFESEKIKQLENTQQNVKQIKTVEENEADGDSKTSLENDKNAFDPFFNINSIANPFGCKHLSGFNGKVSETREKLVEFAREGTQVYITSPYETQALRISKVFTSERNLEIIIHNFDNKNTTKPSQSKKSKNQKTKINVLVSPISSGFSFEEKKLLFLTDTEFFGKSYKRKRKFKNLASAPIDSFLDLKEGDFIVHVNHGVGRFVKLEKIKAAGRERDFLILEYSGQDRLYVPLDQISLVQRYIAPTEKPRLDHLGKKTFKKTRERVEKKIEEFAEELIRLYAIRMSRQGYQYPADTIWQEEFEAEFPYDETPDQLMAIESVKNDMENSRPMDRLICGDVGFGKTEVAIRAAFKAAMAGRQVALIAPTTILAMQHFRNISNRFSAYPISVDWISRFRTNSEKKDIKRKLMKGELDLVIGTHALLSNSILIKNLGLLIVDEEQRFGVKHKEAIKRMRKLVDVMTLSATPIPRTLHMSMIGVRDLSIIQTPPSQRRAVQTYVLEDNDTLIRQAILREVERGGQVFYLHNRVQTIDSVAVRLQQLLPDVTLDTLHGQLPEDEIEDKLLRFVERKFDVMVTTTIIENGIDMPNVNTLIVDRADAFGLSQLYQIRGRVGRSDRQAYAYFLYNPGRALTESASKRLNTILEYQELGSGFKVAMRDLEIRGAGNMLGQEQSGQIVEVGYEMYINLLENAVKKLRGEPTMEDHRCALNLKTDFYIPEDYIEDTRQRISFYKRFEGANNESEVDQLVSEMQDRYGIMPEAAVVFAEVERIRAMSSQIGFEKVYELEANIVEFAAGSQLRVDINHLISCLQSTPGLSMKPGNAGILRWKIGDQTTKLSSISKVLRKIVKPLLSQDKAEVSDNSRHGVGIGS